MNSTLRPTLPSAGHRRRGALAGAVVAGALVLSACSGGDGSGSSSGGQAASASSVPADATFNTADVAFAADMVPHHQQAVEMAELVPDRSTDPDVLGLAERIRAAQGPEIETLDGWLAEWGADTGGDSGSEHEGMHGMMSDEDMSALQDARGTEFDRMWVQMMLEHHTGAVDMARTEITDGEDADAVALARSIQTSQSAEITEMERLLQGLPTS